MTASDRPTVAVTMGDPAGVGSEIIVAAYERLCDVANPIVIGDASVLEQALDVCDSDLEIAPVDAVSDASFDPTTIPVLDLGAVDGDALEYGVVREEYGEASLAYIERAIELALAGEIDAMATAPINKQATRLAGSEYAGHTGMLADYTDTENYSMMLVEDDLIVTHVSTHVPLREACELVTTETVLETIRVTDAGLRDLGIGDPEIAVAGLNPHASDGGLLGDKDDAEIRPAVEAAREEGIDAQGPESPDTVYVQAARGNYDCVVSMYHDQGHIPIKTLGFSSDDAVSGVNVTIGLPIVRTSVDHGTAFDIAGEGVASEASLIDAVEIAADMARRRSDHEQIAE
ncbi:4-hydroxythreonine-4-phosphate dehydrogenase PdxA [Natronolimnobius sp. AArcel1]|uniref:4-hydroxythreonine-4-phosphate dehydrogenase PdxA n=1 Tax=Natronolimnobius sp. AArcel1 TaxID=1679093 RepID=UPI0013E9F8CB|nr:4-hydroxythreonine-4-phosphate dehydrogenase PdxA [Natronolimnobius sp. AArcel1]NGM67967.1 4-hydroxythreonine-4-phosphate dehydrogenase PdxA [Natronolimnobius sp. AArcel1]